MSWNPFKATLAPIQTIELKIGDLFNVEAIISDAAGLLYRNVTCAIRWPVGVVNPTVKEEGTLNFTDGDLLSGLSYDLIVKQVADEVAVSKTLKSGSSVSQIGTIASVQFKATAVGTGEILLVSLDAIDDVNGALVHHSTASEGSVSLNSTEVEIPPTGVVLFKVRVVV